MNRVIVSPRETSAIISRLYCSFHTVLSAGSRSVRMAREGQSRWKRRLASQSAAGLHADRRNGRRHCAGTALPAGALRYLVSGQPPRRHSWRRPTEGLSSVEADNVVRGARALAPQLIRSLAVKTVRSGPSRPGRRSVFLQPSSVQSDEKLSGRVGTMSLRGAHSG